MRTLVVIGGLLAVGVAAADLKGTVKTITGDSLADAEVALYDADSGRQLGRVRTSADGAYGFFSLPPGTFRLRIMAPGFASLEVRDVRLSREDRRMPPIQAAIAGRCEQPYVEWLRPMEGNVHTGTFSGKIQDHKGRPIANAEVTVHVDRRPGVSTRTDSAGAYTFAGDEDEYRLLVRHDGFFAAESGLYSVQAGFEAHYSPSVLDKCPRTGCLPSSKPIHFCE